MQIFIRACFTSDVHLSHKYRMAKIMLICPECRCSFERYVSTIRRDQVEICCSRSCASKRLIGIRNPNFGNCWDDKQRAHQSRIQALAMRDPAKRYAAGKANRGKKFSDERRAKMGMAHIGKLGHSPTEERRNQIGKESSERWKDPSIRKRIIEGGRLTKEAKGLITPHSQLSPWKRYWQASSWLSSYEYTTEKNLMLRGLCKDHIVGRKQGFELGIPAEILRHPENCQVISTSENTKKARRKADPLQPQLLFERIMKYNGDYPHHEYVTRLVGEYLRGKRHE
jgi:hypothetical protein